MVFVMELADMLACEARFWEFETPQTPLIRPFLSELGPGPKSDKTTPISVRQMSPQNSDKCHIDFILYFGILYKFFKKLWR